MIWISDPILEKKRTQNLEAILCRDLATFLNRESMKFENNDYVAAVVWVLQPTQPLKEQPVSCEPLINQTKTGNTRCSFSPKVDCEVFLCLNV